MTAWQPNSWNGVSREQSLSGKDPRMQTQLFPFLHVDGPAESDALPGILSHCVRVVIGA